MGWQLVALKGKCLAMNTNRIEEQGFHLDLVKYYEGLMCQGNGYMHVRGSHEDNFATVHQDEEYERKPANVTIEKHRVQLSKWGTFIPGVAGRHPWLNNEIINCPFFFETQFYVDGKAVDLSQADIQSYQRYLDLPTAELVRNVTVTVCGTTLQISHRRFVSFANRHEAAERTEVQILAGTGTVTFETLIDAGVRTNGFNHFTEVSAMVSGGPDMSGSGPDLRSPRQQARLFATTNGGDTVSYATCLTNCRGITYAAVAGETFAGFRGTVTAASSAGVPTPADGYTTAGATPTAADTTPTAVFEKRILVATSRDLSPDCSGITGDASCGESGLCSACTWSYDTAFTAHCAVYEPMWANVDIVIEGDVTAQLAARTAVYHLLRNSTEDDRFAICAKGHAGEAYFGHYFWDTEINLLPFYLYTDPSVARNLLMYRYRTLDGARKNAAVYGYHGARYAWESATTGEEECPNWQYCDHEVHVTADIIYAMEHYYRATGDREFISDYALPVMVETSRYWCDRVDWFADGTCGLLGVMGPDEYLPMTSNNAYTNNMVRFALERTLFWIDECSYTVDGEVRSSIERTLKGLKTPVVKDDGVILQCDEFESYADLNFDELWLDRSKCFGTFISQEKNYRSKALKQADVLEMLYLFPDMASKEQLAVNYDYYEPITTHDSSLSAAIHGILASRLKRRDVAWNFFEKVMAIDMDLQKRGAEEGVHIANFGGLWQQIVFGFAGVGSGMWNSELKLEPQLPLHWTRLQFNLTFHGQRYQVVVTEGGSCVIPC